MLDQITWDQFLAVMAIALVAWYGTVLLAFYGREVKRWIMRKANRVSGNGDSEAAPVEVHAGELEQVAADLRGILERAGKEAGRQQLLSQLSARLASYAGLRQPAFRVALINLIIREAERLCDIRYSHEEVRRALKEPSP